MKLALIEATDGDARGEQTTAVLLGGDPENGVEDDFYDLARLLVAAAGVTGEPAALIAAAGLTESPLQAAVAAGRLAPLVEEAAALLSKRGLLDDLALPLDSVRLRPPIPRPNRILAIGRNYAEHAKEQGKTVFEEPIVFLKASTSVIGPDEPIEIPDWAGRVDYEGELLVVLGSDPDTARNGKHVPEADAMDLVVGYSLFNDVTARALQRADQERKHPWFRSKSLDTFGPLGPYLVTSDEVPDPHDLRLSLAVNGEIRQDDTTGSMVYSIPALIAFLSKHFRLEPGDVIATGTPSGIGPLVPGDTVTVTIPGLGSLTNPVVAV